MVDPRREIPGVDTLLASPEMAGLLRRYPRERVATHLKRAVDAMRDRIEKGSASDDPADPAQYASAVERGLAAEDAPSLRPVINATGVVLHTNLGRAPLAEEALAAMDTIGPGYSNLELDLPSGRRGSRYAHCVSLIAELTGAEDALVVNNCAAALVLAVNTVARGGRVAVSRGELVEIGGGFRIPDILVRAGATLVEVGSTNRTRADDYGAAIQETAVDAILKVHRSNFRMTGFTQQASIGDLAALADPAGIPLIHDVGSGLLIDPSRLGLPEEPRPASSLGEGADLVVFSGDKLLGGPQAGLVAGAADVVSRMRANPLCRALRVDKATLAGLEATLRLYRDPEEALDRIPALRMLAASPERLEERARALAAGLPTVDVDVAPGHSAVGGGTFPGIELPSWTLRVTPTRTTVDELALRLREGEPPVVARREEGALVLDLRTIAPAQEDSVLGALARALSANA